MPDFRAVHRLPRARIDPIDTPYCALSMIIELMNQTLRFETIVLMLDHERRGLSVIVVGDTDDADSMVGVIDSIADQARQHDEVDALIVASVRPDGGPEYDDLDRWADAAELCDDAGLELVEWFVLGTTITCPRELCGDPPRWAA